MEFLSSNNFTHVQHCRPLGLLTMHYYYHFFPASSSFTCVTCSNRITRIDFDITARNRSICTPPTVNVAAHRIRCVNKFDKIDWHKSTCTRQSGITLWNIVEELICCSNQKETATTKNARWSEVVLETINFGKVQINFYYRIKTIISRYFYLKKLSIYSIFTSINMENEFKFCL